MVPGSKNAPEVPSLPRQTHVSMRVALYLYSRGVLAVSSLCLLVTPISFVLWIPTWPNMLNDAQG
jgi:hypothetical protein